jgi:hypothetical protein
MILRITTREFRRIEGLTPSSLIVFPFPPHPAKWMQLVFAIAVATFYWLAICLSPGRGANRNLSTRLHSKFPRTVLTPTIYVTHTANPRTVQVKASTTFDVGLTVSLFLLRNLTKIRNFGRTTKILNQSRTRSLSIRLFSGVS